MKIVRSQELSQEEVMKNPLERTLKAVRTLCSLAFCLVLAMAVSACSSVSKKEAVQSQKVGSTEKDPDEEARNPSSMHDDVKEIMTDFHKKQRSLIYRK
jgi:hypothetical protein